MGLKVSKEQKNALSMVDLAHEILRAEKQPMPFQELSDQIKEAKAFPEEDLEEQIARFYTNMNLDGRFKFIGENHWGLRKWYPFDQQKEDIEIPAPKRKKKKKKAKKEEDFEDYEDENSDDFDEEDYEDFDEEDYDEEGGEDDVEDDDDDEEND
jgi:DNA-directed RNA polymerase subunit delta